MKHEILKCISEDDNVIIFNIPSETGALRIDDLTTYEWVWVDDKYKLTFHTLYTSKTHIAYQQADVIFLHKIKG